MSQISVPVFLMGGSDDIVTPAVPEQINPFTWLRSPNKYLAIMEKRTHFSIQTTSKSDSIFPMKLELHSEYLIPEMNESSIEMLKEVGLGDRVNYLQKNLSGGQKQRVVRALVS